MIDASGLAEGCLNDEGALGGAICELDSYCAHILDVDLTVKSTVPNCLSSSSARKLQNVRVSVGFNRILSRIRSKPRRSGVTARGLARSLAVENVVGDPVEFGVHVCGDNAGLFHAIYSRKYALLLVHLSTSYIRLHLVGSLARS